MANCIYNERLNIELKYFSLFSCFLLYFLFYFLFILNFILLSTFTNAMLYRRFYKHLAVPIDSN